MPTLRMAMDCAYELVGWPSRFSEGEATPTVVFGDLEVIKRRLAEDDGLSEVGSGYTRCEETWQEPLPPGVEAEAA